jgi:hypothetical protein
MNQNKAHALNHALACRQAQLPWDGQNVMTAEAARHHQV